MEKEKIKVIEKFTKNVFCLFVFFFETCFGLFVFESSPKTTKFAKKKIQHAKQPHKTNNNKQIQTSKTKRSPNKK